MQLIERARSAWNHRRQRLDLAGAAVAITGGSRGLGLELARTFGKRGAKIALLARDALELEVAAGDLRQRGIQTIFRACDVTDANDARTALDGVAAEFGCIDVLVNNAGIIEVGPLDAMTAEDYARALATHFWGPYHTIEAVAPAMRARRSGRIVNISSIGGRISVPHLLPYSVSKFALAGYSEGLRAELARDGVYVTSVFPGLMRTGSPEQATFKGKHRAEYAWFLFSDALPFVSVDVTTAAREIVDATEAGSADLVISLPAKIGALMHGVMPGLVTDVLGIVARFLPAMGGIGQASRKGSESHSSVAPSSLTTLSTMRTVTQNEASP